MFFLELDELESCRWKNIATKGRAALFCSHDNKSRIVQYSTAFDLAYLDRRPDQKKYLRKNGCHQMKTPSLVINEFETRGILKAINSLFVPAGIQMLSCLFA